MQKVFKGMLSPLIIYNSLEEVLKSWKHTDSTCLKAARYLKVLPVNLKFGKVFSDGITSKKGNTPCFENTVPLLASTKALPF